VRERCCACVALDRVLYILYAYIYMCVAVQAMLAAKRCQQNKTKGDDGGLAKGDAGLLGGRASVVAHIHYVLACYICVCVFCVAGDASGQRCQQQKTAGDDGGLATGEAPGQYR